jgi:plastocyanin
MRGSSVLRLLAASSLCALSSGVARADVLLDQTNLVAVPTAAAPSEHAFTTSTAQALTVTLTDLQVPAAFQSLQIAVTLGDALVGSVSVNATTHVATLALPAATGAYVLHVIGTPDASANFGGFGVCVAPATSATSCIGADSFSGTIQTPSPTPSGTGLSTTFVSTTAGNYTVTLTDDNFPVKLLTPVAGGIAQGSTAVGALVEGSNTVPLAAGTTYTMILAAVADTGVGAGLYGVQITDPAGNLVFGRTVPVGNLGASTIVNNPSAQPLSLTLNDLQYPAPFASLGVAVTAGGARLAELTAAGTVTNIMAPAGSLEVWTVASAVSQPGVYSLSLASGAAASSAVNLLSTTQVVNPAGTSTNSYAFLVTLPSAGTYQLSVSDFQFPAALTSLSATIAQNGTVLSQDPTSGAVTGAAGLAVVLVNAQPPSSGNGIFAVTLQTAATPAQIILDQTQAVGGVFDTQPITVGTSGNYNVTLTDLGFPAKFANLAVVLSQGSQVLGKIYGSGNFPFNVSPGKYVLTFVATPGATSIPSSTPGGASTTGPGNYGLYAVNVSTAQPTVTFTAGATTVAAGQTVQLTWSSKDATACTAGGGVTGWSGTETISGTATITISATATLTLTCTGPGGSAMQSVSVTATPAPATKSGGGGAINPAWLLALATLVGFRMRRVGRASR